MKYKIKQAFNKRAVTYNQAAQLQADIAHRLAEHLPAKANKILEIGCGTGLFTEYLLAKYPDADFLLVDIAPNMIEACRKRFAEVSRITYLCEDAESLILKDSYDLIVSSMSLHWFSEHQKSFDSILKMLSPAGQFIFAMLGDDSLLEWREINARSHYPVATPLFPNKQELQTTFPAMQIVTETVKQPYRSVYEFLVSLKKIGATASRQNYQPLTPGKMRKLLRDFADEIHISYEVIYGCYTKISENYL